MKQILSLILVLILALTACLPIVAAEAPSDSAGTSAVESEVESDGSGVIREKHPDVYAWWIWLVLAAVTAVIVGVVVVPTALFAKQMPTDGKKSAK